MPYFIFNLSNSIYLIHAIWQKMTTHVISISLCNFTTLIHFKIDNPSFYLQQEIKITFHVVVFLVEDVIEMKMLRIWQMEKPKTSKRYCIFYLKSYVKVRQSTFAVQKVAFYYVFAFIFEILRWIVLIKLINLMENFDWCIEFSLFSWYDVFKIF